MEVMLIPDAEGDVRVTHDRSRKKKVMIRLAMLNVMKPGGCDHQRLPTSIIIAISTDSIPLVFMGTIGDSLYYG